MLIDSPIVWYQGSGTSDRRFLHTDERGSIVSVTDSAGAVIAINSYDEYGMPASTNVGRFQYTGQAWLPEVGLHHYKARMYSPSLGRFMQTDPIGYADGVNWYAYVGNDPVNFVDPLGLCGELEQSELPECDIVVTGARPVNSIGICDTAQSHLSIGCGGGVAVSGIMMSYFRGGQAGGGGGYGTGAATQSELPQPNGCGAAGDPKSALIPNSFEACDTHDICYGTIGRSRIECDNEFLRNAISEAFAPVGSPGIITAISYYLAIRAGGAEPYRIAQSRAQQGSRR